MLPRTPERSGPWLAVHGHERGRGVDHRAAWAVGNSEGQEHRPAKYEGEVEYREGKDAGPAQEVKGLAPGAVLGPVALEGEGLPARAGLLEGEQELARLVHPDEPEEVAEARGEGVRVVGIADAQPHQVHAPALLAGQHEAGQVRVPDVEGAEEDGSLRGQPTVPKSFAPGSRTQRCASPSGHPQAKHQGLADCEEM